MMAVSANEIEIENNDLFRPRRRRRRRRRRRIVVVHRRRHPLQ